MYCRQWKFQLKNKNGQNGQMLWLLAPIVFTAEDVDKIVPPPKDVLLRLSYFRFSKILLEWSMDMDNEKNGNTTKSSLSNGLMTDISLATGRPGDKLLRAIVNDVAKSAPRSALSSLEKLVEYSNQFSTLDGLIRAYFNPVIEKNKVSQKTMYLISITTIWIALFTRPIDSAKLQADRLIKAKREFQICMLYYCFGLLTGTIPCKGVRFAAKHRFSWKKILTIQDDEWCIKLANALMAHFGLEYALADKLV